MKKVICAAILGTLSAGACHATEGAFTGLARSVPSALNTIMPVPAPAAGELLPFSDDRNLNVSQLTELLRDTNPEVRKAAVRSARNYILNTYALGPVLEIFRNRGERADIRVEAARTLSYAVARPEVPNAFAELLADAAEPRELRVMTYKALHRAAADNSRIQDYLIEAAGSREQDPAARRAAVWALFESSQRTTVKDFLAGLLNSKEEESLRLEALKSLYGPLDYGNIKNLFKGVAGNPDEAKPLRLAALKALSGARDSSVDRFLAEIIGTERDQELRAAAVAAAEPNQAELSEYFRLGYKLQNGGYFSPIEKE